MTIGFFETPIEYVKGVGSMRGEVLKKELNIFTADDLLNHFPFRYADRSKFYKINQLNDELPYVQLKGVVISIKGFGEKRTTRLVAQFKDDTGMIDLVWFQGIKWIRESIRSGVEYVVFGKPTSYNNKINIVHPEMELASVAQEQIGGNLYAFYSTTEKCKAMGLDSKGILRLQRTLLQKLPASVTETLSRELIHSFKMLSLHDAVINIHLPSDADMLRKAQFRLKFEELFYLQLHLLTQKIIRKEKYKGHIFSKVGEHFNQFYKEKLPFTLTDAQKRVIKEIRQDIGSGKQMNRLLQGDVGSGKTMVALMCMLIAIDNGFQCGLMAPTEILANQHFESISKMLNGLPITVELITGSVKSKKKKEIQEGILNNKINILIGTHAMIEDNVQFHNPGLFVIDEQHRFGVEQRARLWMKQEHPPHVLVMTATPIPRTLAMTLYGDLDVSVIDELPAGRKSIKTFHRFESNRLRVFGFLKEQIKAGRQIYIVYPLIEESEKMDYANLMQGYESIVREFPLPHYRVSIVHGKMKPANKEHEMKQFVSGITQILVATTVIEVGVDVPNASVMLIESAERFGLSQLHQLRGRVGRGAEQSYCILMTSYKLSADAKLRLDTMVRTNNGFEIADTDLKLRGPGDITGTQQSGVLDLKIADLGKDGAILELARKAAIEILNKDSELISENNYVIKKELEKRIKDHKNWSRIS